MKKKLLFTLTLSLLFILALTGCGGKDDSAGQLGGNDASLIPPAKMETETEFHKTLTPLKYREEETVEGLYHKTVYADGEAYYEVQPDGETEPLRVPVSETVIYGIDEGENYIEKVTLKLDDGTEIPQYQLNVQLSGGVAYQTSPYDKPAVETEGDAGFEKAPRTADVEMDGLTVNSPTTLTIPAEE